MSVLYSEMPIREQDFARIDPHHLIRSLIKTKLPLPKGAAENAVLSWLIALPDGVDPAGAAASLSGLPSIANAGEGEVGRVRSLLKEIARYPASRLARPGRRRRRL